MTPVNDFLPILPNDLLDFVDDHGLVFVDFDSLGLI